MGFIELLICSSFWFVTLWSGCSESFAENSERQIDELDPLLAVDDAIAPYRVEIGEGLFRDGLLGRFSRGLQFRNAIARSDQHVPKLREVRFVAERSVSRNNPGVVIGQR